MFMFSILIIIASYLLKIYTMTFIFCHLIMFFSAFELIFLLIGVYENDIYGIFLGIFALSMLSSYPYFLTVLILVLCGEVTEVLNIAYGSVLKILFLILFIPTGFISIINSILTSILMICKKCKD